MTSKKLVLFFLNGLIFWSVLQLALYTNESSHKLTQKNPIIETSNKTKNVSNNWKQKPIIQKPKQNWKPIGNITKAAHIDLNITTEDNKTIPLFPWDGRLQGMKYPSITKESIKYPLTVQQRIEYYLTPKWYRLLAHSHSYSTSSHSIFNMNRSLFQVDSRNKSEERYFDRFLLISNKYLVNQTRSENETCTDLYCLDVLYLLSLPGMKEYKNECEYAMQFGDGPFMITDYPSDIPVFKKTRFSDQSNVLLLKLSFDRHWIFFYNVDKYDIPWEKKNSSILWRGSMTGTGHWHINRIARYTMVNKYINYTKNESKLFIDMAFYRIGQNYDLWNANGMPTDGLIRPPLSVAELLQAKYLVSIHGNDVASNFNWILYSNSVPFVYRDVNDHSDTSHNKKESWTMQGLLKPYVHFVPFTVRDEHDDSLLKAYEFCETHPRNCSRIAQNGKLWMMQFKNKTREEEIEMKMLKLYCEKMNIFS